MSAVCAIMSCRNYRLQYNRKSFYRFPRNKEICKQWIMRSGRTDLYKIFKRDGPERLTRSYVICSDHFVETDFRNKNLLSQGIWPGAVPSVLLERPNRKRKDEVEPKEPVCDIQMLEVPGNFQKSHEIFISEQSDWSSERSTQEEKDPLWLEEDEDCTSKAEEPPTLFRPIRIHLIRGEPVELSDANRPLLTLTVKKDKIHSSTVVTPDSTQQLTLQGIYSYITCNFQWSKFRGNWWNSVRHTLSLSPLFVKTQFTATRNAHYWSVVPPYLDTLRQNLGRSCCKWEVVSRLQPSCIRMLPRKERSPKPQRRGARRCRKTGKSSASTQKNNNQTPLSSTSDSCCVDMPLPNGQRKLEHQRLSECIVDSKTHRNPKGLLNSAPPRKLVIARAILQAPYSQRSLSTQKDDNRFHLSSSNDNCRVSIPLLNDRRELPCQRMPESIVGSNTDCNPKGLPNSAPPLKLLIAEAIVQSPYRHVPLSEIYAYCIIHCPYYNKRRKQCYTMIKHVLAKEVCFSRVPQKGSMPDHWMFDRRYKNVLNSPAAFRNPWEQDHELYPEHSQQDSGVRRDENTLRYCNRRITDTASRPGSDTDDVRSMRGPSQSSPAVTVCRGRAARSTSDNAEGRHGFAPKQPRVSGPRAQSIHKHHSLHLDVPVLDKPSEVRDELDIKEEPEVPFLDKPSEVHDELDIKEEPFPEELPMENNCFEETGDERQNLCTTLLDANCSGTVAIKQEKVEEYPVTVKCEVVDIL